MRSSWFGWIGRKPSRRALRRQGFGGWAGGRRERVRGFFPVLWARGDVWSLWFPLPPIFDETHAGCEPRFSPWKSTLIALDDREQVSASNAGSFARHSVLNVSKDPDPQKHIQATIRPSARSSRSVMTSERKVSGSLHHRAMQPEPLRPKAQCD